MSNPWVVLVITVLLIGFSAFFVAVEFALIAARRHRLEEAAETSAAARAALKSSTELSVLLAGSQLGITVCTLLLGMITKPAVHHWLTPVLGRLGGPAWITEVGGFVLALIIVTFLHLVVGEMAPKSWAIAHPERSATLLVLPMRAFMTLTRPLLVGLNYAANWCVRRVGVEPVDQVEGSQDPNSLRQLVTHSAEVGALPNEYEEPLTRALDLTTVEIGELVSTQSAAISVPAGARAAEIRDEARRSGHLRLLVRGEDGAYTGVVHARDSLLDRRNLTAAQVTADQLKFPLTTLVATTPVYEALAIMRRNRSHLVVIQDAAGADLGVVTLADVVNKLMPAMDQQRVVPESVAQGITGVR